MTYINHINSRNYLKKIIKQYLFKIISRDSLKSKVNNVVLRTNDVISVGPILFGEHEPHLDHLIENFSLEGRTDYFIDIGSNIGLSILNNYDLFNEFYLYEPNPLVFKILELNCFFLKKKYNFELFNYGIGSTDGIFELVLPKNNWGGAYIPDGDNAYSRNLLSEKDGLFSSEESTKIECLIKSGKDIFDNLVINLIEKYNKNFYSGVIKIDVEGYELEVLRQISLSKLMDTSAAIIFENLNHDLRADRIYKIFNEKIKLYRLQKITPYNKTDFNFIKILKLSFNALLNKSSLHYTLVEVPNDYPDGLVGDLVAITRT